ncbi:hypothetical protein BJ875DRAFT_426183 [Amylocarpus encephaloides]|uniref:Zn(2)-C6 fungal-type domain-containing protein n=1 Tax=Amylocarpus encephaloides TaxID=45428 RepID=A0A9P8C5Q4_9HELO|nr:hypothetical protein BJ875DRAFT_426183 [Amylocarpus encephaloides]
MDNTQHNLLFDPSAAFWLDPGMGPPLLENSLIGYPTPEVVMDGEGDREGDGGGEGGVKRARKARIRASRACIACRGRHTKCDGVEPVCTRCQVEGKTCVYMKSRRGGGGRSKLRDQDQGKDQGKSKGKKTSVERVGVGVGASTDSLSSPGLQSASAALRSPLPRGFATFGNSSNSPEGTTVSASEIIEDGNFVSRYFEFFHNAHPIVLPRKRFLSQLQTDPESLGCLLPVLKHIGGLYTPGASTDGLRQFAHEKLSGDIPRNGFSIQALLLFSLAIHCSDEYKAAEAYLDRAIDIALEINLQSESFAWLYAECDPIIAESWRRTWWTLYCIDAVFAAISHHPNHRLQTILTNVALPCEDSVYSSGKIPEPYTIDDYDNREFAEDEITFSSFTYLIDSCRILSTQLSINIAERSPGERSLEAADAKWVNWTLYLPKCKQNLMAKDGNADETMFLAHIIANCEKMLLHRPHSTLHYSSLETRSKCTPPTHLLQTRALQKQMAFHTAKALEAINASILLFALPAPCIKHSPIVVCALALSVMAQVSACLNVLEQNEGGGQGYEGGRERIRLGLGALRAQRGVWGMAGRSVREVVGVARELLGIGVRRGVPMLEMEGGLEGYGEQSFVDMLADETLVLVDSGNRSREDICLYSMRI